MEIIECSQGSPEWRLARLGIVTASAMSDVLAKGQGKTRASYMYRLIGELITGEPAEGYSNIHTDRGHEFEPIGRHLYQERIGVEVSECGFMVHDRIGYSPDGLIADAGLMEIKTRLPHLQASLLDKGEVPSEHKAQIQCGLHVSGREWLDFVSYWPGMPLFVKTVRRDEKYIEEMLSEVKRFYDEMDAKLEHILEAA